MPTEHFVADVQGVDNRAVADVTQLPTRPRKIVREVASTALCPGKCPLRVMAGQSDRLMSPRQHGANQTLRMRARRRRIADDEPSVLAM